MVGFNEHIENKNVLIKLLFALIHSVWIKQTQYKRYKCTNKINGITVKLLWELLADSIFLNSNACFIKSQALGHQFKFKI